MTNHIKYTKADGETSTRVIYPINVLDLGKDTVKVQAIDLSSMTDDERAEAEIVLNAIRQAAWNKVYESGLKENIRSFFLNQIEFED